jgi:hypothetical protein
MFATDNYSMLVPGEQLIIGLAFRLASPAARRPILVTSGGNATVPGKKGAIPVN